jgi:F0F1-type ATP synthase epsilon subunit
VVIKPLRLTVLTPAETLLDVEEVAWVRVHLADGGGIGIYPGHAPLLAETVTAPLCYADPLDEHALDLEAGILQVDGDGVTVFTSGPARPSKISEIWEVSEVVRFDRLAQGLLSGMRERFPGVLDAGDEED